MNSSVSQDSEFENVVNFERSDRYNTERNENESARLRSRYRFLAIDAKGALGRALKVRTPIGVANLESFRGILSRHVWYPVSRGIMRLPPGLTQTVKTLLAVG